MTSPAEFMAAAAGPDTGSGSSPWASRYAGELRRVVADYANNRPRSLQVHLGPSEIGHACDRQVVGKMAGQPATNHVVDPWPSFVGTALHAEFERVFRWDNERSGFRWVTETRVTAHPDHPGTADLYDADEQAVVDHKCLAASSMAKVRGGDLPRHYLVQLLMYGRGYRLLGLPVRRVAIAAWPRTGSSLHGLYVWERAHTPADDALLAEVFEQTERRAAVAELVRDGLDLRHVPASPSDDDCYFCPFYRPQASRDGGPGCPGTAARSAHN